MDNISEINVQNFNDHTEIAAVNIINVEMDKLSIIRKLKNLVKTVFLYKKSDEITKENLFALNMFKPVVMYT